MSRCAVLGSPIAHSLSPVMHRAAYAELGIDWTYEALEVEPEGLPGLLDGLDAAWRGLSLTMPLKRSVVPLLDTLDEAARISGAANTVLLGDRRRLGFNTDVPGVAAALVERLHEPVRSAAVIGGGATAASVLLALAGQGCTEATLVVRDPARAGQTLTALGAHPRAPRVEVVLLDELEPLGTDLVVSTVPVAAQTAALVAACAAVRAVFEVVYDPWPSPLAQAALDSGRPLVDGLDLLAHQAELQVQIMTGRGVGVDLLRDAGRAELARRAGENGSPAGEFP